MDEIESLKQEYNKILQSSPGVHICCIKNEIFWKKFRQEINFQYEHKKRRKIDIFKDMKNQCFYGYFREICPLELTNDDINILWVLHWKLNKIEKMESSQ